MSQQRYAVTGMTCGHCEAAVREEVSELDGVISVSADAKTGALLVEVSSVVPDELIVAAVHEAGYGAERS